ncbi:LytTR family DNA-binding domain-containing protein [uncultured Sulfitobacter sp.]|uniref:LytTR family DNA-binding domain-containing protein n=1 Tax=uncultured Sulfitobacter sp. TaxID=191468 RepID=UPI00262C10EE|nr:LytTR family DNA-binding domain-containing protein [uncultured Sulfitobacter sp.]
MQFALREMTRHRVPLLIWLVVTAVAVVAGPFGTLDAMRLGGRVLYWGGIAGGSILLSFGARWLARDMGRWGKIAVQAGFVLVVASLAHLMNSLVFEIWGGWADWVYLTGTVGLVTAAVNLVVWAVVPAVEEDVGKPEGEAFLRRLPIEFRGPLVRIEAQDHYLNVVTAKGQTLILMRLGDAIAELEGRGLQVHRSHWIATDAVTKSRRENGRDVLVMADAAQVPVSRSFRSAAQDAGLL